MQETKVAGQLVQRLRNVRKLRGFSQRELAKASGVSQSAIGNIESGRRGIGKIVLKIAQALGVDPHWLFTGEGTMQTAKPTTEKLTSLQRTAKRIAKLKAKLKQARKLAKDRSIAEKKSARKDARTIENRKKVILGAYMLEKHPTYVQSEEFTNWLKRDADRALFGLGPVNASQ